MERGLQLQEPTVRRKCSKNGMNLAPVTCPPSSTPPTRTKFQRCDTSLATRRRQELFPLSLETENSSSGISQLSNFEPSLNLETLQLESCDIPEDEFSVSSDSGNSSCRRLVSREVSHL